ncbi:craniofacial development protein 2-like protein [Tanacetum coccineum]
MVMASSIPGHISNFIIKCDSMLDVKYVSSMDISILQNGSDISGWTEIEDVDSDGHLRSCPSSLGRVDECTGTRSKLLELGDALGRHMVDIACFQETKWKRPRTREGNEYKLWYSSSSTTRKGVGVILAGRLKDNVVQVIRSSDKIMAITVIIDGETVNVISAYASQFPSDQRLIVGGDLNGHIGAAVDGYAGIHGGFGFGDRNEEGRTILEGDLRACKDCRAFLGDACSSQHILVILDVLLERHQIRREATGKSRILWKNLIGEVVETFRATISKKLSAFEDMSASNTDRMWNTLACAIKDAAKYSLFVASESARTHSTHKESWWFCEDVQTKVAMKQSRFKELLSCHEGNQEDMAMAKERYKVAKREAKIAVARAKDKAYEDLYKKLDSKEGANDIYKIANARERRRRDLENVRSTTEAIHLLRSFIEKYRERQRDLHMAFLDLEKAYYNVPQLAEGLNNIIERWRKVLGDNGLRVSKKKMEYLRCDFSRAELEVDSIIDKMRERRLRWFGHVKRRPQTALVGRVEALLVDDVRRKGRPKLRWEDILKLNLRWI